MSYKYIDWKLTLVLICLILISIVYLANQETVKLAIKAFLEWPRLNITIWLFVIVSFLVHYLSVRKNNNNYEGLVYKAFGKFADSAFAAATYGITLTTSSAILKGVYIQQIIGGEVYFNHFGEIDIYSMLVVCLFLFGYSIYETFNALINAIYIGTSESVSPIK